MINPGQTGIVLVLGAGGARGLAHIGVIEELIARGYRIEAVLGCSMGALVGGVYCAGRLHEYKQWACSLTRREVFRLVDFAFGHPGFIKGDRVIDAIKGLVGEHLIEQLPVRFKAVATDLDTRREQWITDGPLFDAIRASIAIPMLLTPHHHQGHVLVDGGLLAPVPISGVAEFPDLQVFAVDVNARQTEPDALAAPPPMQDIEPPNERLEAIQKGWSQLLQSLGRSKPETPIVKANRNVIDLMARSLSAMHSCITQLQLERHPPDVLISIADDACTFYEFWRAQEMIDIGRQAASHALDRFEAGNSPRA